MRILRFVPALFVFVFVLLLLVPLNLTQMASLVVWPFSKKLFRAINRGVCATFFGGLNILMEKIAGVEVIFSGDTLPSRENAFVISNHQAMADIPAIIALATRSSRAGDIKWFVKDPIKYVPGIGWGMLFLDCIYVKRNWMADKARVLKTFENLRVHRTPFWLVSFLEGTRITPEKLKRSQAFGAKAGLPLLTHVMLPRTKGFEATMEGLGEHKQAVYDVTIGYEGRPPGIGQLLLGSVPRVHVHARRYAVAELPKDNAGRAAWALARWVEKEARMAHFKTNGKFPAS
ncbi:MAG: acyltransferase [Proteobacteria bacterium]|nr:MAG: acyltransferase [Pseudomonadota bacterium]